MITNLSDVKTSKRRKLNLSTIKDNDVMNKDSIFLNHIIKNIVKYHTVNEVTIKHRTTLLETVTLLLLLNSAPEKAINLLIQISFTPNYTTKHACTQTMILPIIRI